MKVHYTALLSIASAGSVEQTTLAGIQKLTTGRIPSLSIGSIQAADVPVPVQDLSELRKMDSRIVGIAGEDFLSRFNYMLDYDQRGLRSSVISPWPCHQQSPPRISAMDCCRLCCFIRFTSIAASASLFPILALKRSEQVPVNAWLTGYRPSQVML